MASEAAGSAAALSSFDWQKHLGLIIGVAASALICVKLLAVANWDSTTAMGILAANGTANVLTGTLLTVLPVLYGVFAFALAPRIEQRLKRRTPAERAAARLLETWPAILLAMMVPLGLILGIVAYTVLVVVVALVRHRKSKRRTKDDKPSLRDGEQAPSRFEATSVGLAAIMILTFGTLTTPWLPPEVASTPAGTETVYVLGKDGDTATVLLASDRSLARIDTAALQGEYCEWSDTWLNASLPQLLAPTKYDECPR